VLLVLAKYILSSQYISSLRNAFALKQTRLRAKHTQHGRNFALFVAHLCLLSVGVEREAKEEF
jgi:hypothetical protein